MGKRSSLTSVLKANRRKRRKQVDQRKKMEQKKQYIAAIAPLENTYFLGDHEGSVYRFFKEPEHADALVRGDVYLSTLEGFRINKHPEQGDPKEAHETYLSGHLVGDSNDQEFVERAKRAGIVVENSFGCTISNCSNTTFLPDAYVFCASAEFSPENISEEIGKFCVEIKDPIRFFNGVSRKINSISAIREAALGKVTYAERSYTGLEQPPGPIGFIKPSVPYEKQKEFRFLWLMKNMGEINPPLIKCPEISSLCQRIL